MKHTRVTIAALILTAVAAAAIGGVAASSSGPHAFAAGTASTLGATATPNTTSAPNTTSPIAAGGGPSATVSHLVDVAGTGSGRLVVGPVRGL